MSQRGKARLREIWLALFILGIIFINFPFISIFDRQEYWFGFPPLFLYFFVGWGISIFIIALSSKTLLSGDDEEE